MQSASSRHVTYSESKAWAAAQGFTGATAFREYRSRPANIPSCPDIHYQQTGDWLGWKEYLGLT